MRKRVSGSAVPCSAKYDSSSPRLSASPAMSRWPRAGSAAVYSSTASRRPSRRSGAARRPRQEPVAQGGQRRRVLQHRLAEALRPLREEVGAVQRRTGPDPRVVRGQFGAEVEALLLVGPAGGQLVAEAEVAP